ncbi:MAG: CNNM domain-containing protein [Elusimicrobiota bacterium]
MTFELIVALILLVANVFFVLTEFSLVRVQPARLELMMSQGHRRPQLVFHMLKNLDKYLSAIQLGITICTLGLGWIGEPLVAGSIQKILPLPEWLIPYSRGINTIFAFILITYFQIVFAELVPRSIAIHQAERVALLVAIPFEIFSKVFRFPIWVMTKSFVFISKLLGFPPTGEHEQVFTEEEVRIILNASQEKGLIPLDQLFIIENLFDFADMKVREAMIPKEKIQFLSLQKNWSENKAIIETSRLSRFPVGNPDLTHAVGYVHIKDFGMNPNPVDLSSFLRPVFWAHENDLVKNIFKLMTQQGRHLALVKDSNEKIIGLVTMEDILEELIGEIHDEYDIPQAWSIHSFLTPQYIEVGIKTESLSEAVKILVDRLQKIHPAISKAYITKALEEREMKIPTPVAKGVALPHARISLDRPIILVGQCQKPISFAAAHDKQPIKLIFLILTSSSIPIQQLKILSRIALLASNESLFKKLSKAKSSEEFLDILKTAETLISG